jgi:Icc-related predicted phosphoesterase
MCQKRGINYLCDSGVEIEGYNIWGSPWTPKFGYGWAWNAYVSEGEAIITKGTWIKEKWDLIPGNTDILVTHGPPYGYLDKVLDFTLGCSRSVGCQELREAVDEVCPKAHIFGHIHEGAGIKVAETGTVLVNASQLNEAYQLIHKPIRIHLVKGRVLIQQDL